MSRLLFIASIIGLSGWIAFQTNLPDLEDTPLSPEFVEDDEWEEDEEVYVPVKWSWLRDSGWRPIKSAKLILRDKRTEDGYADGTIIEITEPKTLENLQDCFRKPPLRFATPDDGKSGLGWGSLNFGVLEFETSEEKFSIDIGWEGFHINPHSTNADDVFWQGKLARLLDEIYLAKHQQHFKGPGNLTLAESHVQFLVNMGDLRPEVILPSDEKVKEWHEELDKKHKEKSEPYRFGRDVKR